MGTNVAGLEAALAVTDLATNFVNGKFYRSYQPCRKQPDHRENQILLYSGGGGSLDTAACALGQL